MTGVNDESRSYSSPLRRRQADDTRAAVLRAARELFLAQGYSATTIEQVAKRAGVSKPTVFSAVGNKPTLLKVVRDVAMAGDDEPVTVSDRPAAEAVRDERDQDRAIELAAVAIMGVSQRYAAIDRVLHGAAAADADGLRELWETSETQRMIGARMWMSTLAAKRPPPEGFDLDAAIGQLWNYMAADQYTRLVDGLGWSHARVEAWCAARLRDLLRRPD